MISYNRLAKDVQFYLEQKENQQLPLNDPQSPLLDPFYTKETQIAAVLKKNQGRGQGYVLKENKPQEESPYKIRINAYRNEMFQLFADHGVAVVYRYCDPLRAFIPLEYVSFPGNPGLKSYFQTKQVFWGHEISGKISLYKQE